MLGAWRSLRKRASSDEGMAPLLQAKQADEGAAPARAAWGLSGGAAATDSTSAAKRARRTASPQQQEQVQLPLMRGNPLFQEEEQEEDAIEEDEEEEQWEGGYASCGSGDENSPPPPDSDYEFDDFSVTPELAGPPPLPAHRDAAFICALTAEGPLAALAALEHLDLHSVGAGEYASLDASIAALLVLSRRASLAPGELTQPMLLTLLWLVQATGSQYKAALPWTLQTLLCLHPGRRAVLKAGHLARAMAGLQMEVLQRTAWRVLFRDPSELAAALTDLQAQPEYARLTRFVRECAHLGFVPAADAARLSPEADYCDEDGSDASPSPLLGSGSHASAQTGPGGGLDGCYWRQQAQQQPEPAAAPFAGRTTGGGGGGGVMSLRPRNRR